ncbi:MAG: DGQHR domain-containing protein [Sulfuricurvum sp.]|jgi:DGQHR domain-containing protein
MTAVPLKVELIKVEQLNTKPFFYGVVKFDQMKNIVKKTSRSNSLKEYQRDLDRERVNKIKSFIHETVIHNHTIMPFPTPIIVATKVNEVENFDEISKYFDIFENDDCDKKLEIHFSENLDFLSKEEKVKYFDEKNDFKSDEIKIEYCKLYCKPKAVLFEKNLYFNDQIQKMLIVDGQHRFFGIEEYLASDIALFKDFELIFSFLIDFDEYEQAEIFANINFSQKPVNRSLYYDIFGHLPNRHSELKFAHETVKYINEKGILKNTVRMLGIGPGIISQSFFVSVIEKYLINTNGNFYDLYSIYYDNKLDDNIQSKYLSELISIYFEAIKEKVPKYFPTHALAKDVIKKIDKNDLLLFSIFCQEKGISLDLKESTKDSELTIEEYFSSSYQELYSEFCRICHYNEPTYYSSQYNFLILKVPGIYALLRIFNDLYLELDNEHGPGIQIIISNKSKVVEFYQNKLAKILQAPEEFFTSQKSGGAGIQSALYKKIRMFINDGENV